MQSHYITHRNSTVHYLQFGNGPRLLFCFHGYGRESDTFWILERRLGHLFTIIAIDIPFHGRTKWNDEVIYKPQYLVQFLLQIRQSLQKEHLKFTLLGFSMGGRIALYLTQLLSEHVERLVLLAPDGLNFNFWRWLGTHTWLGNKVVNYTINKPGWAIWVLHKAEELKVIPRSVKNFVGYYIEDEEHRLMLYRRYISTRLFKPSLSKLKRLIKKYQIPVRMMFGSFDRVIAYQGGEQFKEGIEQFASMEVVEAGHNLLSEVQAGKIAKLVND
jgi:pimeloyl-ACP methyl ester carboxylesterase